MSQDGRTDGRNGTEKPPPPENWAHCGGDDEGKIFFDIYVSEKVVDFFCTYTTIDFFILYVLCSNIYSSAGEHPLVHYYIRCANAALCHRIFGRVFLARKAVTFVLKICNYFFVN